MVCAAAPLTSPACVTWAGHLTCPRPRQPQDPLPPAAPETVAATSTATAASGGRASAMSARVSCPPPRCPWTDLKGASSGFQFPFLCMGFSVPSPSSGSPCPLPAPDPRQGSVALTSLVGPQSPLLGLAIPPSLGPDDPPLKQPGEVRDQLSQLGRPLPALAPDCILPAGASTDWTWGEHCERCRPGSFGNATGSGGCRPCQCNGHGDPRRGHCDNLSGLCFCQDHTEGAHCQLCSPGYYGDPR